MNPDHHWDRNWMDWNMHDMGWLALGMIGRGTWITCPGMGSIDCACIQIWGKDDVFTGGKGNQTGFQYACKGIQNRITWALYWQTC